MIKKLLLVILGLFACFNFANAQIEIEFFYAKTCSHCSLAEQFLNEISLRNTDIEIQKYDAGDSASINLLSKYYDLYDVEEAYRGAVPIIFIEDRYFVGFSKGKTDIEIENLIIQGEGGSYSSNENFTQIKKEVDLPFFGTVKLDNVSPLFFSVILGVLDGFNPCAMAALTFLLAVLIGTKSRKKLILLGGIFILVSGIVYYLFMAAWLNVFLVLPALNMITYGVSIVMILLGIFVLKEYFDGIICKLCEIDSRKSSWFTRNEKKLMLKAREIIHSEKSIFLVIGGVIFVAAGINTIELVCSIGFPLAFAKILTSYNLSSTAHYFYLLIYDIFYMLDDIIIFLIAVFTFNLTKGSEKFVKVAKLISGILLILLGIIIMFFPEVLGQL